MFSYLRVTLLIAIFNIILLSCKSKIPTASNSQLESDQLRFKAKILVSNAPDDVFRIEGKLERNDFDPIIRDFIIEADSAIADFGKIKAGIWHLSVTAYSSTNTALYFGETYVNVIVGRSNIVNLELQPMDGNLIVVVSWNQEQEADSILVIQPGPEDGFDAEVWNLQCSTEYAIYSGLCEDINEGEKPYIRVSSWTFWGALASHRSYLKFDFHELDDRYYLYKAKLHLYSDTSSGQTQSGENTFIIHRVISGWDDNLIVWPTQPEIAYEEYLQDYLFVPKSYNESQDYIIDITEMVEYWLLYPEKNYGMRLSLKTEQPYRRVFWASSDNSDHQKHPKIELHLKLK